MEAKKKLTKYSQKPLKNFLESNELKWEIKVKDQFVFNNVSFGDLMGFWLDWIVRLFGDS